MFLLGTLFKSLQNIKLFHPCFNVNNEHIFQEGQLVAKNGSHEAVVFHLVPPGGIAQAELMKVSFNRSH